MEASQKAATSEPASTISSTFPQSTLPGQRVGAHDWDADRECCALACAACDPCPSPVALCNVLNESKADAAASNGPAARGRPANETLEDAPLVLGRYAWSMVDDTD